MERLGRYALIEHLGDDPPWRLYRAREASHGGPYRQPDKEVVLRRLTYKPWDDEGWEHVEFAHIALNIEHPNIEPVSEWEQVELFCVTELIKGWRLHRLLEARAPMPMGAACHVVRQLCEAFRYLRELETNGSLTHELPRRPIYSADVLITTDFDALIRNPALAFLDKNPPALASLNPPRVLAHLSPEEVIGLRADHRSDVYHLGLLMYELVTATRLFTRRSSFETIEAIRDEPPPKPSDARAGLPAWLDQLVIKALSKDPNHRHQSAGDLAIELDELQMTMGWTSGNKIFRAYLEDTKLADAPRPFGIEPRSHQ